MISQFEEAMRHETYIQRLASGISNARIDPAYVDINALVLRMLDGYSSDMPMRELYALQKEITAAIEKKLTPMWNKVTADLGETATYEAGYQSATIAAIANVQAAAISAASIEAKINKPLILGQGAGKTIGFWPEYVAGNKAGLYDLVDKQIRNARRDQPALTREQLVTNLVGTKKAGYTDGLIPQKGRTWARNLVETGMSHYANAARDACADTFGDSIEGKVFSNVFDNRTTPQCLHHGQEAHAGKVYARNDPKAPRIPLHMRCLLGDTKITSSGSITGVSKRVFKGKVVTIKTKSGSEITVTKNHPILTSRGWVAAQEIKLEDKLFKELISYPIIGFNGYDYGVEPTIENIFESFTASGKVSTMEVELSPPEFHGDCSDNEVGIIATDILLAEEIDSCIAKHSSKRIFIFGIVCYSALKSSFCNFAFMLKRKILPFYPKTIFNGHCPFVFDACEFHSLSLLRRSVSNIYAKLNKSFFGKNWAKIKLIANKLKPLSPAVDFENVREQGLYSSSGCHSTLLRSISNFNPCIDQDLSYGVVATIEALRYLIDSQPARIISDDIVGIFFTDYDGHVYNLQTLSETYSASGIVTHNCRSLWIMKIKGVDPFGGTRASVGGNRGTESANEFEDRNAKLAKQRADRAAKRAEGEDTPETASKVRYKGKKDADIFNPGQIDADISPQKFFERQPDWWIKSNLGATRAKLFREGGLTIDKFTDKDGNFLTLKQMRELDEYSPYFKKAGL